MLAHVLIHAINAALQDREVTLNRVRVRVATHIFIERVNNCLMANEFLANFPVDAALICSEMRVLSNSIDNHRLQRRSGHVGNMVRSDSTAALYERHYCFLGQRFAIGAVPSFSADERLVRLNSLTRTADWIHLQNPHRLAEPMAHKPCRL